MESRVVLGLFSSRHAPLLDIGRPVTALGRSPMRQIERRSHINSTWTGRLGTHASGKRQGKFELPLLTVIKSSCQCIALAGEPTVDEDLLNRSPPGAPAPKSEKQVATLGWCTGAHRICEGESGQSHLRLGRRRRVDCAMSATGQGAHKAWSRCNLRNPTRYVSRETDF